MKIVLVIAVAALLGWLLNIGKLIYVGFTQHDLTGELLVRIVGVFLYPLGAVLGYL
jgi:hypothetical protein